MMLPPAKGSNTISASGASRCAFVIPPGTDLGGEYVERPGDGALTSVETLTVVASVVVMVYLGCSAAA